MGREENDDGEKKRQAVREKTDKSSEIECYIKVNISLAFFVTV